VDDALIFLANGIERRGPVGLQKTAVVFQKVGRTFRRLNQLEVKPDWSVGGSVGP
jgi:hypothetical protein